MFLLQYYSFMLNCSHGGKKKTLQSLLFKYILKKLKAEENIKKSPENTNNQIHKTG